MAKRWRSEFEVVFRDEVLRPDDGLRKVRPGVLGYRTKTTRSGGEMLECEVFPIWETNADGKRARKAVTREAQARLNDRNAVRKLVRVVACNFGRNDLMITLTYGDERIPDFRGVQKDVRNFIRRVKDARKRAGLDELKYVYSVEGFRSGDADDSSAPALPGLLEQAPEVIERKGGVSPRPHVHMILSDGLEREVIEHLWGLGWANCRRLQPDHDTGLEAISRYMVKSWRRDRGEVAAPEGYPGKRWYGSRNLAKPKVTVSDWKMSRRKVERVIEGITDAPGTVFNQAYPGYELVDVSVRSSEFVSGVYIYARMVRRL